MPSPFSQLKTHQPPPKYDEWGGQFSCMEIIEGKVCLGWSNRARYYKDERLLMWSCQYGHTSELEDVDE